MSPARALRPARLGAGTAIKARRRAGRRRLLACTLLALTLSGCAMRWPFAPDPSPISARQLPPPDLALAIEGLGPCNDNPDRRLHLARGEPVTVLVHGCNGSAGRFRSLAEVLAFHGRQSACFSYDDRDSLVRSSGQLASALARLADATDAPALSVIGHSQGGLVARKALVETQGAVLGDSMPIDLVTVSAPFSGIRSANPCALPWLRLATLGLNDLMCWLVSGDKWFEITSASDFIREPGSLATPVRRHLMIVTDEAGSCRERSELGHCRVSDFVFTLDEQRMPAAQALPPPDEVDVAAGHVEIVGFPGVSPDKLIAILQAQSVMPATAPGRQAALQRLLAQLYR